MFQQKHLEEHLHRKHKKSGKPKDREAFLKHKHLVQHKLKTAHSEYLENLLGLSQTTNDKPDTSTNPSKCSPKKLFSYIKNTRQDSCGIAPLRKDGLLHTENKVKADILNQQFQSVFTQKSPLNLEQLCKVQIIHNYVTEGKLDSQQCSTPEFPEMPDITISTAGIDKLLKNVQPNKAAGPDDLKPAVLKELHSEIAPILQTIFQVSLNSGTLPDDWTNARVTPIYKKGDKAAASNYRPISLTCICCKLMEHIVTSNLVKHLNTNNILYDLQHGFREKRSCETQLVMLVEDLARSLQEGKQTDLVLLDFSKAFDKVNHEKLLYKLHQYGITGNVLQWVRGFLCHRT